MRCPETLGPAVSASSSDASIATSTGATTQFTVRIDASGRVVGYRATAAGSADDDFPIGVDATFRFDNFAVPQLPAPYDVAGLADAMIPTQLTIRDC